MTTSLPVTVITGRTGGRQQYVGGNVQQIQTFDIVKQLNGAGLHENDIKVRKEVCVSQVQNRFATALRKFKNSYTRWLLLGKQKMISRESLTSRWRYFSPCGTSVQKTAWTNVEVMRNVIMSLFHHSSSYTEEKRNHSLCLQTNDLWCFFILYRIYCIYNWAL